MVYCFIAKVASKLAFKQHCCFLFCIQRVQLQQHAARDITVTHARVLTESESEPEKGII